MTRIPHLIHSLFPPIILILFLLPFARVFAQPDTLWTQYWDRGNLEYGNSVNPTSDGGFILSGGAVRNGTLHYFGWVAKTDLYGNLQWEWELAGDRNDDVSYVEQTLDGGYIVGGATQSYSPNDTYCGTVVKLSPDGSQEWRAILSAYDDAIVCVRQLPDESYIAAGIIGGLTTLWQLDADGETQWVEQYQLDIDWGYPWFVEPLSDGSFVMTGYYDIGVPRRMCVIKVDTDHQLEWFRYYPEDLVSGTSRGYCVRETYDGNIVVCGYFWPDIYTYYQDWCLLKLDMNGDIIWQQVIEDTSSEYAFSVIETPEHDLVVGGMDQDQDLAERFYWLVKTNSEGEIQWQSRVAGGWIYSICQAADGGFVGTGEMEPDPDAFPLLKWEADTTGSGVPYVSTNALPAAFTLGAYPNPFNASTTISLSLPAPGLTHVLVYNSLGQQVATLADRRLSAGEHSFPFDATGLASGVYVIRAMSLGQVEQTQKVVLVR